MSWRSSKQDNVADSTIEAEYIATSDAAKEVVWIKNFVFRLGVVPSITNPVAVYCYNNGAIAQPRSPSHISDPNTYSGISTSFVRSLREEMLRYVEFILMIMLLIL